MLGGGSNESQTIRLARASELRALGEKAITRMHAVHPALSGDGDERIDIEIRADRFAALRRTDQEGFVSLEAMQGKAILLAVDRDCPESELGGGTEAPNGDFRSVGNQELTHDINAD